MGRAGFGRPQAARPGAEGARGALSAAEPRALVGSACLWSWFDAGFMGLLAPGAVGAAAAQGFSPSLLSSETLGTVVQAIVCVLLIAGSRRFGALVEERRFIVASGAAVAVCSLASALASTLSAPLVAAVARVLRSAFVSLAIASWGGLYCREGSRSALMYVTGGFALALPIDLVLLAMVQPACAAVASLLPLASALLLASVDEDMRSYLALRRTPSPQPDAGPAPGAPLRAMPSVPAARRASYFGIAPETVCGLSLIMAGFGYTQLQVSLETAAGLSAVDGPVVIQLARGVVALGMFAVVLARPRWMDAVSRAGLLVFIAGFAAMPFVLSPGMLWAAGMAVLCGYTVVDVLIWVVTAQAASIRSSDALRTVCLMRLLINCVCQALGRAAGVAVLVLAPEGLSGPLSSLFGYLMTAGVVLLLYGHDIWDLFRAEPPVRASGPDARADRVAALAEERGLTPREREVFGQLAEGRSRPWIARRLGITESTVSTHARSVYEKLGVTDRQQLIDLVAQPPGGQSCGSGEEPAEAGRTA